MLPPLIITLYKVFPRVVLVLAQVLNSLNEIYVPDLFYFFVTFRNIHC